MVKLHDILLRPMKKAIHLGLYLIPRGRGVPILGGPLKGKLLPRESAQKSLSMLFGRFEAPVVSQFLSGAGLVKIAYDVGAHVGYMTLVLTEILSKEGTVFAFEPVPFNHALIRKLVFLNGLNGKVQLVPLALGDTIGKQRMVVWESSLMNQLETTVLGKKIIGQPTINTAISTLDSFVLDQSNPPPDLIKIDVEGAEAMVIAGGLQTLREFSPKLLLEIHGPANADRIYELLQSMGYEWWRLRVVGLERVLDKRELLSFFSRASWTHHFWIRPIEMKGRGHAS
jgi:FkbM family methyltransferase